jgi:hypothetical protein
MAISIQQAQTQLLSGSFLDTLGQSRDDVGVSLDKTDSAILRAASRFITDCQNNLIKADRNSSGALSDSITPRVIEFGNGINIVQILVAPYYKFVDSGVQGLKGGTSKKGYKFRNQGVSKSMLDSLEAWVKREGIAFRNTKKAVTVREQKRATITSVSRSTAYGIGVSIKRKGLKPTMFWTDALNELEKDILTGVADALRLDIIENL